MKVTTSTIDKEEVIIVKEKVIQLELSEREAFWIKALVGNVGGKGELRDFCGSLFYKLDSLIPKSTSGVFNTIVTEPNPSYKY